MWGKRLKERIRWNPQGSPFAAWTSILLVLMATLSVFVVLGDRHFIEQSIFFGDWWGGPKSESDTVTLTASDDHTFYWNQEGPYPISDFHDRLAGWLKAVKRPQILITGDDTARFGDTVRLLDEVRLQGIKNFQIETQTRARP